MTSLFGSLRKEKSKHTDLPPSPSAAAVVVAAAAAAASSPSTNDDDEGLEKPKSPLSIQKKRLMKEYCKVKEKPSEYFTVELVNENLSEWDIKVHKFDPDSPLSRDMKEREIDHVHLNATFPERYPFSPPFVRVVSPKIVGGFVMKGGAICMELLTPRGWTSAYCMEAVVLQFVAAASKGKSRVAATRRGKEEFKKKDAEKTFKAVVMRHELVGWHTPPKWEG